MNAAKTIGLDGITPKILKSSAETVCPTLLEIVNISLKIGQFPDDLKIAKLLPFHKGGAKDDPSNYRPISILPGISKLIEKHITKHLFGFLNKHKLLHKSQSGFRKHHSCNTALINLVDKWLNAVDKGAIIGAIFFDLKKAFYVVNHEILLNKPKEYKFDQTSLNWMCSYLSNRKQCIVEHKLRSSMQPIKAGVPQGSILGPVLFLLFVNDRYLLTKHILKCTLMIPHSITQIRTKPSCAIKTAKRRSYTYPVVYFKRYVRQLAENVANDVRHSLKYFKFWSRWCTSRKPLYSTCWNSETTRYNTRYNYWQKFKLGQTNW